MSDCECGWETLYSIFERLWELFINEGKWFTLSSMAMFTIVMCFRYYFLGRANRPGLPR